MRDGKLILRRESFGGILADTARVDLKFMEAGEYEEALRLVPEARARGRTVVEFDALRHGYPLLGDAASSPIDLFLELTRRCNGRCLHCYADSNSLEAEDCELSFLEVADIIKQFSSLGGCYVRLTGGEPTVRTDFFEIVDLVRDEGLGLGLNTNGMLTDQALEGIIARRIEDVRVSLDGPKEVNDRIRGNGCYDRALSTLQAIAGCEGMGLTINVVLMRSNAFAVADMIGLARELQSRISFGLLRPMGRADRSEMLTPAEVAEVAHLVNRRRIDLGLPSSQVRVNYDVFGECTGHVSDFPPYPFDGSKCRIGVRGLSINTRGRVAPCGYLVGIARWVGEDVRGGNLLDLWHNSRVLQESRRITRRECAGCGFHRTACNGGCPATAYMVYGDLDAPDPYCVRHTPIVERLLEKQS